MPNAHDEISKNIAVLKANRLFENFADHQFTPLLAQLEHMTFMAGEPLWTANSNPQAAFVLLTGRIEQSRRVEPDGLKKQHFEQPGTWLALSALVQTSPCLNTTIALERATVLRLPRAAFQTLFDQDDPAAYILTDAIAESLVHDMYDTNRRLHEVFGYPAETLRTLRRRIHKI